jgi:hypothetical protein
MVNYMLRKEKKSLQLVVIYIWHGKGYLPTQALFESGIFVDKDPVHVAELKVDHMTKAIQVVKDAGHALLPDPKTREEFLARKSPILQATGAHSWKQLAQRGVNYSIGWTENEIRVDMSRLDKKGRWEYDPNKVRILSSDTPLVVLSPRE